MKQTKNILIINGEKIIVKIHGRLFNIIVGDQIGDNNSCMQLLSKTYRVRGDSFKRTPIIPKKIISDIFKNIKYDSKPWSESLGVIYTVKGIK